MRFPHGVCGDLETGCIEAPTNKTEEAPSWAESRRMSMQCWQSGFSLEGFFH